MKRLHSCLVAIALTGVLASHAPIGSAFADDAISIFEPTDIERQRIIQLTEPQGNNAPCRSMICPSWREPPAPPADWVTARLLTASGRIWDGEITTPRPLPDLPEFPLLGQIRPSLPTSQQSSGVAQ